MSDLCSAHYWLRGASLNEAVSALQALKACTWCLPATPPQRKLIHGPSENCQQFVFFLSFLFLSFALAYIFAWHFEWSKKIILYTCWMAWIHIHTHTHTCDCLYVCVLANSFDSACRLRLAGIMTFFLAVVAAFICCCWTEPARSSCTPWPWLRGDLCVKIHFFCTAKRQIKFLCGQNFRQQSKASSYLRTNKHRNKLHISNGRRVFAPL